MTQMSMMYLVAEFNSSSDLEIALRLILLNSNNTFPSRMAVTTDMTAIGKLIARLRYFSVVWPRIFPVKPRHILSHSIITGMPISNT